ncbi:hypothetical protein Sjap_019588 [Stephania japonica]|uniref:Uncharacterized protein n=1 Tax=Stephania japonica TaxID=461633 RepID=A0AAP0EZQ2_9MAGN
MARFCCSIETEPRTLNQGQLSHAREAAVDMVQKLESNGRTNMTMGGLMRPVISAREMEEIMMDQQGIRQIKDLINDQQHDGYCDDKSNSSTGTADVDFVEGTYDVCACTITIGNAQPWQGHLHGARALNDYDAHCCLISETTFSMKEVLGLPEIPDLPGEGDSPPP